MIDGVAVVLEYGVALPVTYAIRIVFANWKWRRRPERVEACVIDVDRI